MAVAVTPCFNPLSTITSKIVPELLFNLSVTMAPNVKEILEMAGRIGNKGTASFLANCPDGKHANEASIKTVLSSLQAEEKRLRRNGKGKGQSLEREKGKVFK